MEMDHESLSKFAAQNRNKKHSFSFSEEFKKRSEGDVGKTISSLCQMLMNCMKKYLAENATVNWESCDIDSRNIVGKLIQVAIDITVASLQYFVMQCHVDIAVLLNGILTAIPSSQDSVKNSICHYCEKLFLTNFSDRSEYFLYNVLLYLFRKTLGKKVLKADIKRIYALRSKLEAVIKLPEAQSDDIWELIKQCAISQTYLSMTEGQKVIALAMSLDVNRIIDIHYVIRRALLDLPIRFATFYGRIYFETWCYIVKFSRADMLTVLEVSCLEDFIVIAICGKRLYLPIIRKILAQFHIHKKDYKVSKLLYGLYQPLLWRYLKNPDGQIRANSSQLFLDIFPLEDPEVKIVNTELEMIDQQLMIKSLLLDEFPIVRITAVVGICVSMSVNWEVYPEEILKTYFRIIVNDLSRDSSTPEVRCAVVKGLKCLLENPLTLRCLVGILPKMCGLFHDICENVRIAFCQLLLRVKKISAIKFFHVVPIKHLFARLEEDCHAVKKSITNLLNNSYFPKCEDSKVWLGRCLEIIRLERNASRVFFTYVGPFIGIDVAVRFMVQSIRAVHFYVKSKNSPLPMSVEISNKENIVNMNEYLSSFEQAAGFNNLQVVSSMMDAITVMWLSLKECIQEPGNKYYLKALVAKISQPLADLCLYYKETEAWESVFYVSSYLPSTAVPSLGSLCFWRLKNLPLDAKPDQYMALLECLCHQCQGYELLHLLKEWIEIGLSDSYVPPSSKRRRRSRKTEESVYYDQPKPYLANQMLNEMINHKGLQKHILMHEQILIEMLQLMDYIKRKLQRFNIKLINEADASFLDLLMHNLLRISVLIHDDNQVGGIPYFEEVVEWVDQKLTQHLTFSDETPNIFTNMIHNICQNLSQIIADVVSFGFCENDCRVFISFFRSLLHSELGYKYAYISSKFLYKYAASSKINYIDDNDTTMLQCLLESLCKIFDDYCNETLLQSIPLHQNIPFVLANVMQVVYTRIVELQEVTTKVFKHILKIILNNINIKTKDIVEELDDDPFDRVHIPTIGIFFLTILNLKPNLIPVYLKHLNEMFLISNKDISSWISNWIVVYDILGKKDMTKPILREANGMLINLKKVIHEIYPRSPSEDDLQEHSESPKMLLFQQHCHAELLKLRSRLLSKVSSLKDVKT